MRALLAAGVVAAVLAAACSRPAPPPDPEADKIEFRRIFAEAFRRACVQAAVARQGRLWSATDEESARAACECAYPRVEKYGLEHPELWKGMDELNAKSRGRRFTSEFMASEEGRRTVAECSVGARTSPTTVVLSSEPGPPRVPGSAP